MNDITKLPKWAQQHIATLERQREEAVKMLDESTDSVTPSPFSFESWISDGESTGPTTRTHYVQAHAIDVSYAGVNLRVLCVEGRRGIELQWGDSARPSLTSASANSIVFQPRSLNQALLFNVYNRMHEEPWVVKDYEIWRAKYEETKAGKPSRHLNGTIWSGPQTSEHKEL